MRGVGRGLVLAHRSPAPCTTVLRMLCVLLSDSVNDGPLPVSVWPVGDNGLCVFR